MTEIERREAIAAEPDFYELMSAVCERAIRSDGFHEAAKDILRSEFSAAAKVALLTWDAFDVSRAEFGALCPAGELAAAEEWAFARHWDFLDDGPASGEEKRHVW